MKEFEKIATFKDNRNSLRELSKDNSDGIQYMTESMIEAVDFDALKTGYVNALGLSEEAVSSVDALILTENCQVFVEFKNGDMKNEKRKVKDKVRDSLLLFCDIAKKDISYTRQYMDFVLVYNLEKNPIPNQLTKGVQESPSRVDIAKYFSKKAGEEFIRFELERFKKVYFRNVHTYSSEEFEDYLKITVPAGIYK